MAAAWDVPVAPIVPPGAHVEQRSASKPAPIQIPQTQQSATTTTKSSPGSPQRPPVSPITPVASFAVLAQDGSAKAAPPAMTTDFPKAAPDKASEPRIAPPPASRHLANSANSTPSSHKTSFTASDRSTHDQTPRSFAFESNAHSQSAQEHAHLKQSSDSAPQINYTTHPVPVSIPESDNTDAQALRAALAVLQIQRDKSTRDIRTLTTLKEAAAHDPQRFVDEMLAGKLGHHTTPGAVPDPLRPTLEDDYSEDDSDNDNDEDDAEDGDDNKQRETSGSKDREGEPQNKKLPKFPTRQNIVRCPPVNWAKYHVLGDSLDKLHEEQRRRPTPGEPGVGVVGGDWMGRDHVVAAPYSPWVDALQHPMQTRRGSKKPLG